MSKSILVTGSSSGIGRATAERFAQGGYTVFASMRSLEKGEELAAAANEAGWDLKLVQLDVSDDASVAAALNEIHVAVPALDVVVNNAGLGMNAAVEEATDDEIMTLYNTNILGVVRVLRHALPTMRDAGAGTVINVSSMGAHAVWPFFAYYHSTKFAIDALSDGLKFELEPFGVNVYTVEPGLIASGFGAAAVRGSKFADKTSVYREENKAWVTGFMDLLDNRVGPETVGEKIFELAETQPDGLRHQSDPFAEQIVSARREKNDHDWIQHFKELHGRG